MLLSPERFAKIVIPLTNITLKRGLIDRSAPWIGRHHQRCERFCATIDGDIPALVEVAGWDGGENSFSWVLWPKSADVRFDDICTRLDWLGDVYGTAHIDRRISFRLHDYGFSRSRRNRHARLDQISQAALHSDMVTSLVDGD